MQEIEKSQPATTTSTNGTRKENAKNTPTKAVKKEATPKKRKAEVLSSEDEFIDPKSAPKTDKPHHSTTKSFETTSPVKKVVTPATKKSPRAVSKVGPKSTAKPAPKSTKKAGLDDAEGDLERKAILESIETVDLPDIEPGGDTKYHLSMTKLT